LTKGLTYSACRPKNWASSHPWHDLAVGEKAPEEVNAVVEIPAKSKVKYELDKDTGMLINACNVYVAVFMRFLEKSPRVLPPHSLAKPTVRLIRSSFPSTMKLLDVHDDECTVACNAILSVA
jgi:hypothetical protein